jgi:hypothetical protein
MHHNVIAGDQCIPFVNKYSSSDIYIIYGGGASKHQMVWFWLTGGGFEASDPWGGR